MSLNHTRLTPYILQQLYKDSLVSVMRTEVKMANSIPKLEFLGGNQKRILIIVNEKEGLFLAQEDLEFLIDILGACKLSLGDIALINFNSNEQVQYTMLMDQFNPAIIMFLGIEPGILSFPLQFPHYQVQSYNKQVYLSAPPLAQLQADKQQKSLLWKSLQKLFGLK